MEKNIGYTTDSLRFFFSRLVLWMAYSLSLVPEITHENMMLWVSRTQNYVLLSILIMISASDTFSLESKLF